jgi:hypothetical protein
VILGVVAASDDKAAKLVEAVSDRMATTAELSCSIRNGVAIAAWSDLVDDATFMGDATHVGTMLTAIDMPRLELPGDFALIARTGASLRLARGRFAGRPLFWAAHGSAVVACNRLLPLMEIVGAQSRLNLAHIVAMFDMGSWENGALPIEQARLVRANTVVDIDCAGRSHVEIGRVEIGSELRACAADVARALREEFQSAIARQCSGMKRIAVFAGGGVDSSNLLATAVRGSHETAGPTVIPVALDFGGIGDDRPYRKALGAHLHVESLLVRPAEGAAYAGVDHVVDGAAHSTAPGGAMLAMMARAHGAGAEAAFVGDGSELLLDSDGAVFADFIASDPLRALTCGWRLRGTGVNAWQRMRHLAIAPFARRYFGGAVQLRRRLLRKRKPWEGPRLTVHYARPSDGLDPPPILSQRDRIRRLASSPLLMGIREHASRWETVGNVRLRLGYFDDEFVRFVGRIPSAMLFTGDRERGLLRESMAGMVPDMVRYRSDKAVPDLAFSELFLASGGLASMGDLSSVRELGRLGFVEADSFRRAFEQFAEHPGGNPGSWFRFWTALTAEAYLRWFSGFLEQAAQRPATLVAI